MSDQSYYLFELFGDQAEDVWQALLASALQEADFVEFAAPVVTEISGFRLKKRQWQPSDELLSDLVEQYESQWKYQVKQRSTTTIYRFRLTPTLASFIQSAPLWAWGVENHLPEDPAFYFAEHPFLWTISHEQYVFAWLTPAELATWQASELAPYIRGFTKIDNRELPTKRP